MEAGPARLLALANVSQLQAEPCGPPTAGALAAALERHGPFPPFHRRLLRFVLGGLPRRGAHEQQQQQQDDQLCELAVERQQQRKRRRSRDGDAAPQQLLPPGAGAAAAAAGSSLAGDSLCGSSDDGTDVLGMSPFASCVDLQAYRAVLQQQRAAREAESAAAAAAAAPRRAGPLRAALAWLMRLARGAARHVSPQGEGSNDSTLGERLLNLATSVPFVLVGMHSLRSGTPSRRHFGASFVATGVIAALYHGTSGAARRVLRKADYWSIAYTSCVLRAASGLRAPAPLAVAAALITPLRPTLVTGANLAAIEARYLLSALRHSHLRAFFGAHLGVAVAGVGCFLLEDVLVLEMGLPPVAHALWHSLSAAALGLIGPLLSHCHAAEALLLLEGVQATVAAA
ncbi:hypothetical protein Rsub_05245 [Raphidocelis subcapitata]|uniref:Uncharacterized protein n=1 Tax=Raphidocelis subcapitata TaxID=307507 RepID=A0A2V0NYC1_9CHLO|nr:hypothetical protein Rsub_05245 [Raphidocelis subcapitata]|eukprot:GBF92631.1 hypothetical protein Rsub_05245 [Raphidocelis subcapitata]